MREEGRLLRINQLQTSIATHRERRRHREGGGGRVSAEGSEHLQVSEELSEFLGVEIIVLCLVGFTPCQSELYIPWKGRKRR
jgi:hypothetical protein